MSVKKINGYRIFLTEKLGKGSYGTVYKGESNENKMEVAVKILDKSSSTNFITLVNQDPYLKSALISEIKIMKTLKSENIVRFYDVMESSNNYYIIQELCDGDLQHYLRTQPNKTVDQKEAIQLLTEICNAFLTLAKEGIVHRDLKPANIFMSKGHCKIGDFGFAKKVQTGLKNQTAVGTPLYMSIELLKGQPYTSKCDIWAMGFILYQILHGTTPWSARSEYELIQNIEKKPLKIMESLSPVLNDFLRKCLKINEENRISWDQIFRHEIFKNYFIKEVESYGDLQNKFKKIMGDIRFQVNSNNLDLKKIWFTLGFTPEKELNQQEFKDFIYCIVPNIAPAEEQYFFHKMDVNKDGAVSLKELQVQLQKHDIPLTSVFQEKVPFLLRKIVSLEDDQQEITTNDLKKGPSQVLQKKIQHAFRKLDEILIKKSLPLSKVFKAYDGNKSGQLQISQFCKILKKLDSSFQQEEIEMIFDLVDVDHSKTIEFEQLKSYFCKINGIPEALHSKK